MMDTVGYRSQLCMRLVPVVLRQRLFGSDTTTTNTVAESRDSTKIGVQTPPY